MNKNINKETLELVGLMKDIIAKETKNKVEDVEIYFNKKSVRFYVAEADNTKTNEIMAQAMNKLGEAIINLEFEKEYSGDRNKPVLLKLVNDNGFITQLNLTIKYDELSNLINFYNIIVK